MRIPGHAQPVEVEIPPGKPDLQHWRTTQILKAALATSLTLMFALLVPFNPVVDPEAQAII